MLRRQIPSKPSCQILTATHSINSPEEEFNNEPLSAFYAKAPKGSESTLTAPTGAALVTDWVNTSGSQRDTDVNDFRVFNPKLKSCLG